MSLVSSVSGFPRIGQNRELKKVIERYWKRDASLDEVRTAARALRAKHWKIQHRSGVDLIPSNDFSYYDQVLDTAILFNIIPQRYRDLQFANPEDTLFALARGYQGEAGDVTALPMKKWFTTNYHYIVPELEQGCDIRLVGTKPFDEFLEAQSSGIRTKPVIIGPYTLLRLVRTPQAQPVEITDTIVQAVSGAYVALVERFIELGAKWIQFDEPFLVTDNTDDDAQLLTRLYEPILQARLGGELGEPSDKTEANEPNAPNDLTESAINIALNTYFGHIADIYQTVNNLGFDGLGLDLIEGRDDNLSAIDTYGVNPQTTIFAGVISGRNIWANNYAVSLGLYDALRTKTDKIALSTACSLLHVPFSLHGEEGLGTDVTVHLAGAVEKLSELVDVAQLSQLADDARAASATLKDNQQLFDGSRTTPDAQVQARLQALTQHDFERSPARSQRRTIQGEALGLPLLPTTTIGSFPQTAEIRAQRAAWRTHKIDEQTYRSYIRGIIDDVLARQEEIGLDVLVHGEFERNDMVEYFGQHLEGFLFTANAWVQSYGTRCVKPPIIWSDVRRSSPITVEWSAYAQSRTDHIVKGMLTGPVTILNWSWPREDVSIKTQTEQLALAIRDEVLDLEREGIRIIQIDEAALREKLPLRKSKWHKDYLDWAIPAFRLVHAGVQPSTQIHTHMCYSEFNDIIRDIDAMDADVISFEASRADLVILDALQEAHFETQVGPGVYDIHSPRIPSVQEIEERIDAILEKLPVKRVWINPDCGLKTRGEHETWESLKNVVAATKAVRERLHD